MDVTADNARRLPDPAAAWPVGWPIKRRYWLVPTGTLAALAAAAYVILSLTHDDAQLRSFVAIGAPCVLLAILATWLGPEKTSPAQRVGAGDAHLQRRLRGGLAARVRKLAQRPGADRIA